MAYTLEYNNTISIVELVYKGRFTAQESRESASKAIALGKEHSEPNALVDASEAELAVSIIDLLDLPAHQYAKEGMNRKIRIAVIPPMLPKDKEDARFYETACLNRGWQVRIFPNRDEALEWLADTASTNNPDVGDV